jgi:hypothetical protein
MIAASRAQGDDGGARRLDASSHLAAPTTSGLNTSARPSTCPCTHQFAEYQGGAVANAVVLAQYWQGCALLAPSFSHL